VRIATRGGRASRLRHGEGRASSTRHRKQRNPERSAVDPLFTARQGRTSCIWNYSATRELIEMLHQTSTLPTEPLSIDRREAQAPFFSPRAPY